MVILNFYLKRPLVNNADLSQLACVLKQTTICVFQHSDVVYCKLTQALPASTIMTASYEKYESS